MTKTNVFQTALGISTGDIVTTSYGTGPFIVTSIHGPRYVQHWIGFVFVTDYPLISLGLVRSDDPGRGNYGINDIRQVSDRWFTESDDEVFVEKGSVDSGLQMGLFTNPDPAPYAFNPDVDYSENAWRCKHCEYDFNALPHSRNGRVACGPFCERCGLQAAKIYFRSRTDSSPGKSVFTRAINAMTTEK